MIPWLLLPPALALDLVPEPLALPAPAQATLVLEGVQGPMVFALADRLLLIEATGVTLGEAEGGALALALLGQGETARLLRCGDEGLQVLGPDLAWIETLSSSPCSQVVASLDQGLVGAELGGQLWTWAREGGSWLPQDRMPLPAGARLVAGSDGLAWFLPGEASFELVDAKGMGTEPTDLPVDGLAWARETWWSTNAQAGTVQALGEAPVGLDLPARELLALDLDGDGELDLAAFDPEGAAMRLLTSSLNLRLDEVDAQGGAAAGDLGLERCEDLVLLDAKGAATLHRVEDCPEPADRDGDGWTRAMGDCDDEDPDASPEAEERCDTVDQDCDGVADLPVVFEISQLFTDEAREDGTVALELVLEGCTFPPGSLHWDFSSPLDDEASLIEECSGWDDLAFCYLADDGLLQVHLELWAEDSAVLAEDSLDVPIDEVAPTLGFTEEGEPLPEPAELQRQGGEPFSVDIWASAQGRDDVQIALLEAPSWVTLNDDGDNGGDQTSATASLWIEAPAEGAQQTVIVAAIEDEGSVTPLTLDLDISAVPTEASSGRCGGSVPRSAGLGLVVPLLLRRRRRLRPTGTPSPCPGGP